MLEIVVLSLRLKEKIQMAVLKDSKIMLKQLKITLIAMITVQI